MCVKLTFTHKIRPTRWNENDKAMSDYVRRQRIFFNERNGWHIRRLFVRYLNTFHLVAKSIKSNIRKTISSQCSKKKIIFFSQCNQLSNLKKKINFKILFVKPSIILFWLIINWLPEIIKQLPTYWSPKKKYNHIWASISHVHLSPFLPAWF